MSIISNAPYYDKYDREKHYTQLLAVPGRVAQAREITEIQSTLKDIIKSLGDSFLNDGNIIEGCQVIPDATNKTVTVTDGKIYMRGLVMNLKESTIDITASGTEIIGVKLKESIIYESDDPDLRDPALGYENYNQPGMDRLKSELEVVVMSNSETSEAVAMIATLVDGELSVEQQAPNYSALNETLARRTYDESGSYIVDGLNVRVESHPTNTSLFNIVVESGKAYVHGYELTVPSARRISMERALTSTSVTARYTYAEGSNYLLTTGPYVKSITKVTGALSSQESVTISSSQGAALRYNTAYKILSVSKGGQVIDSSNYSLEQGPTSYIRWNNTTYPGDNVVIKYYYNYDFEIDKDCELYLDPTTNNHYLRWLSSSVHSPVVGESLAINYEKYLARKDTVYMDQYGNINVLQGIPADYGVEVATDAPAYTLPLSIIMSPPGGVIDVSEADVNISASNIGLTRFTMSDIHDMLSRIKTMAYDQTVLSLNIEAKDSSSADKRGIFTDAFIDFSKVDLDFNLLNGERIMSDRPIFDTTIDLDSNMIYLPLISKIYDTKVNESSSSFNKYDRVASLRTNGERVVLSQMNATKSFLVSPYLSYPQAPEIFIDPSLDSWYDDTIITIPVSIDTSSVISSSTRKTYSSSGSGSLTKKTKSTTTTYSSIGTTVDVVIEEDLVKEEAITYCRKREINVEGKNYPTMLDNIKCYVEGVEAPLTPTGSTVSGTLSGSVKSNASGSFTAKFTIPDNIMTGTRVVTLESSLVVEGYSSTASTFYKAIGIARTFQKTVTTINTVLFDRVTTTNIHTKHYDPDPLAQTFILDDMTLISGIDVYFESVPAANVPVTCEIRGVQNGTITSTIYGFKTLSSNEIRDKVSSDASKPTRFRFNDPVLIEANTEYAFVLKSSSQDFRVFIAEIGETDLQTHEMVLSNPYLLGVMMSSSNNSSWTTHQKSDVKFRLIADTYEKSSTIVFNNINAATGFCRMTLSSESLVFEGTSIDWFYSLDNGSSYQSITPYNLKTIDQLGTDIIVKAQLTRNDGVLISPLLALDSVSMSLACYDNSSDQYYISKLISGLVDYQNVEIILDTYKTSGADFEVYISSSSNNATPYVMTKATEQSHKELNYGWFERTYKATLGAKADRCRIFVKFTSTSKYHTAAIRRLRAIMS